MTRSTASRTADTPASIAHFGRRRLPRESYAAINRLYVIHSMGTRASDNIMVKMAPAMLPASIPSPQGKVIKIKAR